MYMFNIKNVIKTVISHMGNILSIFYSIVKSTSLPIIQITGSSPNDFTAFPLNLQEEALSEKESPCLARIRFQPCPFA